MKKTISFLSLLLIIGFLITGCKDSATPAYYDFIPGDAYGVLSLKAKQLIDKSGVDEEYSASIVNALGDYLPADMPARMERLLKNGKEAGIDLHEDLFVFMVEDAGFAGMVMKVEDPARLKEAFKILQTEGGFASLKEENGYYRAVLDESSVCVFNDDVLISIVSLQSGWEQSATYASSLICSRSEQAFSAKKVFKKMQEGNQDISFILPFGDYMQQYASGGMLNVAAGMNVEDMYIIGALHFEPGEIKLSYELFSTNMTSIDKMKRLSAYWHKMNNRFISFFPESTLMYAGMNIDGEEFYSMLDENKLWDGIGMNKAEKTELKNSLSSLKGDISAGVTGFFGMGIPAVSLYAEVKDDRVLDYVIKLLKEQNYFRGDLKVVRNKEYEFNYKMLNLSVYFGMRDNLFYLTTDKARCADITRKADKPLTHSPYVADLKQSYSGWVINVEEVVKLPLFAMGMYLYGGVHSELLYNVFSELAYVEALSESDTKFVLNLHLKNKETNSLRMLLSFFNL
ncbi:DUF4836 family protein [Odoribacter sp. OttesenSCG-928-J03]|nr:DUF4836 family protein [Odoribacter sp. OttesenSCG-928-J03]MDL2283216.1 DUF4836 family protein [Odoribacter sp. OttesenSCG-928-G04]